MTTLIFYLGNRSFGMPYRNAPIHKDVLLNRLLTKINYLKEIETDRDRERAHKVANL